MSARTKSRERKDIWRFHIQEFSKSGLTQRAYCKEHKISYWSFNYWKRKIENETGGTRRIIELPRDILKRASKKRGTFEIEINDAVRISIPDNFSTENLKKILRTLGVDL